MCHSLIFHYFFYFYLLTQFLGKSFVKQLIKKIWPNLIAIILYPSTFVKWYHREKIFFGYNLYI